MESDNKVTEMARIREQSVKKWMASDIANAQAKRELNQFKIKFDKGTSLLAAVAADDVEEITALIKSGCNVNYANADGLTSLHRACINERLDIVKILIENGADINFRDHEMWTPLHAVATTGPIEIVKYLVEHGADVGAINSDLDLPYDLAEDEEIKNYLESQMIKRKIDPDQIRDTELNAMLADIKKNRSVREYCESMRDEQGATPLHVAAAKGYKEVAKTLLSEGVDPNIRDNDGWTPLHAAVYWSDEDLCRELLSKGADPDATNNLGSTPKGFADEEFSPVFDSLVKKYEKFKKLAPPVNLKNPNLTEREISRITGILKAVNIKSSSQDSRSFSVDSKVHVNIPFVKSPPTISKPLNSSTTDLSAKVASSVTLPPLKSPSNIPTPSVKLPPSVGTTSVKLPPSISNVRETKQSDAKITTSSNILSNLSSPIISTIKTINLPPSRAIATPPISSSLVKESKSPNIEKSSSSAASVASSVLTSLEASQNMTLSEALEKIKKLEQEVSDLKKERDSLQKLFTKFNDQKKSIPTKDSILKPSVPKPSK